VTAALAFILLASLRVVRVALIVTCVSRELPDMPTQHATTFSRAKIHGIDTVSCRVVTFQSRYCHRGQLTVINVY